MGGAVAPRFRRSMRKLDTSLGRATGAGVDSAGPSAGLLALLPLLAAPAGHACQY